MLVLLASIVSGCLGSAFRLDSLDVELLPSRRSDEARVKELVDPGLNETLFPKLPNVEINATHASESEYPWIARVVHSTSHKYPHVCTASCIRRRIFVTSAGCVNNLKIVYTSIVYQGTMFPAQNFVVSDEPSKQLFDDIGIIVVERKEDYRGSWPTIDLTDHSRTGEGFKWFADWAPSFGPQDLKAVGFGMDLAYRKSLAGLEYYLVELDVIININLCHKILSFGEINGFYVPCYHACTLKEHKKKDSKCHRFIGVEGAALVDVKGNKLIGVATWSAGTRLLVLPVGFAVPNSERFLKDYQCAINIVNDDTRTFRRSLQSLCQ